VLYVLQQIILTLQMLILFLVKIAGNITKSFNDLYCFLFTRLKSQLDARAVASVYNNKVGI